MDKQWQQTTPQQKMFNNWRFYGTNYNAGSEIMWLLQYMGMENGNVFVCVRIKKIRKNNVEEIRSHR